jgi:hypothetical protein
VWRSAALFASLADAQLEENALERAEAGEGRLEKVEADERREEQPELIHPISKGEPGEHKRAGDEVDDALYFHSGDVHGSDLAAGDNVEASFAECQLEADDFRTLNFR